MLADVRLMDFLTSVRRKLPLVSSASDNPHCVNFRGVDFAVVILAGEPCGSMHAAVRIRRAAVYEVCGGLGRWDRGCMQPPANLPP